MNSHEAKEILTLFRPGTADEQDASFAAARLLIRTDPELARWFDDHCAAHLVLRRKFQEIPIPPGLKEQIISERKIQRPFLAQYWGPLAALAAAVMLLMSIEFGPWFSGDAANNHTAYVQAMTHFALTYEGMSLETNQPALIREFLAQSHAPANYSLFPGLAKAEMAGCMVAAWQDSPVSMICFKSGRPLAPGKKSDLWLFVVDRAAMAKAPRPGNSPVFEREGDALTASWSDKSNTYLLAAVGDEGFIGKYLH